jgi:hypothetical protein
VQRAAQGETQWNELELLPIMNLSSSMDKIAPIFSSNFLFAVRSINEHAQY